MTYRHRRLRRRPPVTVLRFRGGRLTAEMAAHVSRQWLAARRRGVAVVDDQWDVLEVTR